MLHDVPITEGPFEKALLWPPLFRVGANSKLAARIEQIRRPRRR